MLVDPRQQLGIVIAGHGSRDADGIKEFEQLIELIKERAPQYNISHGYLEFAAPTIEQAVTRQLSAGANQIIMVPAVLLAATHAKNDLPSELLAFARKYPGIDFHFGSPLSLHPLLLQVVQQRIIEAESTALNVVRRTDTCLVFVGRGTTDPDANGEVAKFTRMIEEGMGFGGAYLCFSGTAKPLVADGLRAAAKLGYARLIVVPFFLFDGILVKRIYDAADALQEREPTLEVLKAAYLGVHPKLADVIIARAQEAIEGHTAMNCSLCKYRVQIVGFEEQVGEPQRPHHLQVRGLFANGSTPSLPLPEPQEPGEYDLAQNSVPSTVKKTALTKTTAKAKFTHYLPHPIEVESFRIISAGRDWSIFPSDHLTVLQRLVHTSGDFNVVEDIYFSSGAVETGIRALLRCKRIVTDVTMVEAGLKRALLEQLDIETWCGVHHHETALMAQTMGITRSAAGIRRAFEKFGNDIVLSIGDAPTAIMEATRLIREQGWRPQLVIGLPVGFVGTAESKAELKRCLQVPRITNSGTRGGSPWAATVINGLMIDALNRLAGYDPSQT